MLTNKIFNYQFMPESAKLFLPADIEEDDILFFDIETTGLSHRNSRVYLIGAALCTDGKWEMIQFLAQKENEKEEYAVLEAFQSLCARKRCFLHFNGSTFDIPYLQHKYQSYRLTLPFKDAVSVDLYRTLRPLRTILQTENFRQKSLEPLAGYRRQDAMDGKELIKVYRTYAKTGGQTLLNLLFLHNHDDVEGMGCLLAFGALLALLRGNFRMRDITAVTDRAMDGSLLQEVLFTVKLPLSFPTRLSFSLPCAYVTLEKDCCKMKMPLLEGTLKYYYPDYKNLRPAANVLRCRPFMLQGRECAQHSRLFYFCFLFLCVVSSFFSVFRSRLQSFHTQADLFLFSVEVYNFCCNDLSYG